MVQTRRATIDEERAIRHKKSAALYEEAKTVFPGGVTHDGRFHKPFPIYVSHAKGSRKWDVDGNEYVDYFGGHGALLLGHCHPAVTAAVVEQAQKGSHYGACHELEIRWGQLVKEIIPCAKDGMVKFVSSGTEATLMAMRVARAFTGKDVIVKMRAHFHGWHDYATVAMSEPWDVPSSAGVPKAVQGTIRSVPFKDIPALEAALAPGDVAAVILLQNGATTEYLQQVKDLCKRQNVLLIFDEVITGFRYAPGGAQEYFSVTPDMCTNAKILAGGYPGGSVAGRKDVMQVLEHRDDPAWQRHKRVSHPGTFNASPVSAAAGIACLEVVRDPSIQKKAIDTTDKLRAGMNDVLKRRGVAGRAGGEVSLLNVSFEGAQLQGRDMIHKLRSAMQLGGVDFSGMGGPVSAVHDDRDVEHTVRAFDQAVELLQADGAL